MSEPDMSPVNVTIQNPSDYFDQIPQWNADRNKKRFAIMSDERIPVTRVDSFQKFTELLDDYFFASKDKDRVFRGQRRHDWGLEPSLGRIPGANGVITSELAEAQLTCFKLAVRGRLKVSQVVEDDDELWAIGQHYGLKTPLLDWTYSPYVALFFAFHEVDPSPSLYRVVYILNKSFLIAHQLKTKIRVLDPRTDDHGRLVSQAGLFTFSPYGGSIEGNLIEFLSSDDSPDKALANAVQPREKDEGLLEPAADEAEILARYICKIYIRNEERDACLRHLRRMNVHHASLFPDLLGASEYCNVITTEAEMAAAKPPCEQLHTSFVDAAIPAEQPAMTVTTFTCAEQNSIEEVLRQPAGVEQVESGRIALLAKELAAFIAKNKVVVDWKTRDAVQARLRNGVRAELRKHSYPQALREQVAEQVLALAKLTND